MPPLKQLPASITSLTDKELRDNLKSYNTVVGPILPSTRRVYEKKLFELRTGERVPPLRNYEPVDDDEEEDEEEYENNEEEDNDDEEDKENNAEAVLQAQPRQRITHSPRPEVQARSVFRKPSPRRPLHPDIDSVNRHRSQPLSRQSPQKKQSPSSTQTSRGLPLWVTVLIIIVIAVLVFFFIKCMESNPVSNIPERIEA